MSEKKPLNTWNSTYSEALFSCFFLSKVDDNDAGQEKNCTCDNISGNTVSVKEDSPEDGQQDSRALNDGSDQQRYSLDSSGLQKKAHTGDDPQDSDGKDASHVDSACGVRPGGRQYEQTGQHAVKKHGGVHLHDVHGFDQMLLGDGETGGSGTGQDKSHQGRSLTLEKYLRCLPVPGDEADAAYAAEGTKGGF